MAWTGPHNAEWLKDQAKDVGWWVVVESCSEFLTLDGPGGPDVAVYVSPSDAESAQGAIGRIASRYGAGLFYAFPALSRASLGVKSIIQDKRYSLAVMEDTP